MDTLMTGKDFIARLDELLNERCMSVNDIHKKVKLSSGTLSKMRSNGSDPTFRTIQLVCIALGVSLSEFFDTIRNHKTEIISLSMSWSLLLYLEKQILNKKEDSGHTLKVLLGIK